MKSKPPPSGGEAKGGHQGMCGKRPWWAGGCLRPLVPPNPAHSGGRSCRPARDPVSLRTTRLALSRAAAWPSCLSVPSITHPHAPLRALEVAVFGNPNLDVGTAVWDPSLWVGNGPPSSWGHVRGTAVSTDP